ncbi:MAG: AsmA family protein [Hyphomonadaceae bacterium]|nr:AsmA family protein [Hyphomonadaceae bacterium]
MRRVLLVMGAIILAVVAAAAAVIAFFPKDLVIAELKKQVAAATGRTLTIAGDTDVTVWPALGLSAGDVTLSNPEGFSGAPFLTARQIVFAVSVAPLLRGDVEVKRLFLDTPSLALVARKDAAPNWTFPTQEPAPGKPAPTLKALRLDDMRITDGDLSFVGEDGGAPLIISDIDATVALTSLDEPARLDGALAYRDEAVKIEVTVGRPRALLEQGETPLALQIDAAPVVATLDGAVNIATGAVTGRLNAKGASLRRVLAWTGSPLPDGPNFAAFGVEASMTALMPDIAFTGGAYTLDAIAARGDVTITAPEGGRLSARGAVRIPTLDVNPYLPPPPPSAAAAPGAAAGVNTAAAWDATPLDLSGLKAIDADLDIGVGDLRFQKMQFTDSQLRLRLTNGVADAVLSKVSMYGGAGAARLQVDATGAAPAIRSEIDVRDVQALGLLTAAIGFDKIEGRGRLKAALTGRGRSQADIMRSLGGTIAFSFNDGAWRGVNLAQVARTVQAALSGQSVGASSKTDFAEFAADFTVANGAAATSNLRLLNPFVRLDGTGVIDIGAQATDIRLAPRAVRSLEGQGGDAALAGIGVPFRARGPWSKIAFAPDLEGLARAQVSRALGGQSVGEALGGLLGRNAKTKDGEAASPLDRLLPRK